MWMREEGKMWSERKKEKKCGKREKKMREEGKMSSERKKEKKKERNV